MPEDWTAEEAIWTHSNFLPETNPSKPWEKSLAGHYYLELRVGKEFNRDQEYEFDRNHP